MLTIGVASNEPLDAAGVNLDNGGLALGSPSVSGTNHTWTYTVKGSDNTAFDLSATAKDAAGNAAAAAATGSVTLDGVVPEMSGANVSPDRVKGGESFEVAFTASEALPADPEVTFSNGSDAPSTMTLKTKNGNDYVYEGTAPQSGSSPYYTVTVTLSDGAGNQTTSNAGTMAIDNVAPQLAGLEVAPAGAKLNDTIRVVLTADEPLSGPPALTAKTGATTITFAPADLTPGKISYAYTYVVTGATTEGVYTVQPFELLDVAGNARSVTPSPAKTFSVDSSVPVVQNVASDKAKYSRVAGYNRVTVTFDASEDVGSGLSVKVGGQAMACDAYSATAPNYTCRYDIQPADTAGTKSLNVQAADVAGNTGFGSGSVEYDFGNPAVVSAAPSQGYYKGGQTIAYTVSVSEPLLGNPGRPAVRVYKDSVLQPDYFANPSSETDTSFTYTKAVTADGVYTVEIDLTDKAGNAVANAGSPVGWTIDATAPNVAFTPPAVTTNNPNDNTLAKNGEVVTAVFNVNEAVQGTPTVTIGGQAMSCSGAGPYTCTRTATTGDGSGVKTATVTATDTAGNVKVQDIGSVTYDFIAPSVTVGSDSIQLIPFAGCLLPSVTKVALNTTARVTFTASEPLLSDPSVTINPSAGTWSISKYSSAGNTYIYDIKPTGGSPTQGVTQVRVVLTDKAGNGSGTLTLSPTFAVDTVKPTTISWAQNDRILYRRIPWGSDATTGVKKFSVKTLDGETNAVEANATIIFWDASNTVTASEIGRTTADGNGYFAEKELNRADRAAVFLSQVDEAGNLDNATATEIKNHEWTATMGYKVAGSTIENPNTFDVRQIFSGARNASDSVEVTDPSGVASIGGSALSAQGAATWTRVAHLRPEPAYRDEVALAYDSERGRTVLFGGSWGYDETWEWNGLFWEKPDYLDPEFDGDPPRRQSHAVAYDAVRGKVVLFGGSDPIYGQLLGDTWEWDGSSWTRRCDGVPSDDVCLEQPSARERHAMAFDPVTGNMVLFGGSTGVNNGETWEWDGATWERRYPANAPSARRDHAMAADPGKGTVVLFGGYTSTRNGETWEWNGYDWTRRCDGVPAGDTCPSQPTARFNHSLAYDNARGNVVLFAGSAASVSDETWEWDGSAWALKTPADPESDGNPSARTGHGAAFDVARGVLVVFGGSDGANCDGSGDTRCHGTWEWDGTSWAKRIPADPEADENPSARTGAMMVYDNARKRSVLFGGWVGADNDETWEYDGTRWTRKTPADPESDGNPSARTFHAMAFDTFRSVTVLFGGHDTAPDGETWEWNGTSWNRRCDGNPPADACAQQPSARYDHAMAYDSIRQRAVLFGGSDGPSQLGDTWEWNGTIWDRRCDGIPVGDVCPSQPASRSMHGMAYDSIRQKVVLFGGNSSGSPRDDTWEWDGTSWVQKTPTDPEGDGNPSARYNHSMVFDNARQKIVIFGGFAGAGLCEENGNATCGSAWDWDGISWVRRPLVDPEGDGNPMPRYSAAAAFDLRRSAMMIFGGDAIQSYCEGNTFVGGTWCGGTWEMKSPASDLPGQAMQVPLKSAVDGASVSIETLRVNWYGGGTAGPSGSQTNGAQLYVWDQGLWKIVASNSSPAGSPSLLPWASGEPAQLGRLFTGLQSYCHAAVAPAAENGTGQTFARVTTDYAEVIVDYYLGKAYGWGFDTDGDKYGWVPQNISAPGTPSGGVWTFTLDQGDPILWGPPINIKASDYPHLKIRVMNANFNGDPQLFWIRSDDAAWNETKSQWFFIAIDGQWHTYSFDLSSNAEWTGTITQIRFDPTGGTGNQPFSIDWIRLTD